MDDRSKPDEAWVVWEVRLGDSTAMSGGFRSSHFFASKEQAVFYADMAGKDPYVDAAVWRRTLVDRVSDG